MSVKLLLVTTINVTTFNRLSVLFKGASCTGELCMPACSCFAPTRHGGPLNIVNYCISSLNRFTKY